MIGYLLGQYKQNTREASGGVLTGKGVGWGGSLVVVDQDAGLCAAFVMNKMGEGTTGDMRAISLLHTVFAALAD